MCLGNLRWQVVFYKHKKKPLCFSLNELKKNAAETLADPTSKDLHKLAFHNGSTIWFPVWEHLYSHSNLIYSLYFCFLTSGAFHAFDKDGDGIIKLNVLEVNCFMRVCLTHNVTILNFNCINHCICFQGRTLLWIEFVWNCHPIDKKPQNFLNFCYQFYTENIHDLPVTAAL